MYNWGISMVRGDTFTANMQISDTETEITGIVLTVKRKGTDTEPQFKLTVGDGIEAIEGGYRFRIAPEKTASMKAGAYVYDIQLTIGADVYTVLGGKFKLIQDVSNEN